MTIETSTVVHVPFNNKPFEAGALDWLATAGGTRSYQNPHSAGVVVSSMSTVSNGDPARFVQQTAENEFNFTKSVASSWMAVDLGPRCKARPTHYCLRTDRNRDTQKPRSWNLEGSTDGKGRRISTHDIIHSKKVMPLRDHLYPCHAERALCSVCFLDVCYGF